MNEIVETVGKLHASWKRVYETAEASPSSWQPYLPYSSLVMIDEIVESANFWLSRVRAPTGFSPGFKIAKSLAASSLPSLLSSAKNLEAGQYNHFPTFINGLMTLLSTLHTMVIYSQKHESREYIASMSADLSQSLALLSTAQHELSEKAKQLEAVSQLTDEIDAKHRDVLSKASEVVAASERIVEYDQSSSQALDKIHAHLKASEESEKELRTLVEENAELKQSLQNLAQELDVLQKESVKQSQTIDSILPKAASAGLAAAFASRGKDLNLSKWVWMGVFVLSLASLAGFAYYLTTLPVTKPEEFWQQILYKIPLAAPLIWLGWFSAIQYGGIIRVQEDYAFKEATSKAFQGYRDHLEHLASVNLPEAGTAMNLLAARTIEILAHEPLRIYGKTEKDASPAHSLLETISGSRKKAENS